MSFRNEGVIALALISLDHLRLNESEAFYDLLFKNNPDAIFIFDLNGNFYSINPSALRTIGYSQEEVIGKSYKRFVFKENLEKMAENFKRMAQGESLSYEFSFRHNLPWMNPPLLPLQMRMG